MTHPEQSQWHSYCTEELAQARKSLAALGYTLLSDQPHIQGERYLMQALTTTSGRKLILLGENREGARVVIKVTSDPAGKRELTHDRRCRLMLRTIRFSYSPFHSPEELFFGEMGGQLISIQRFIEQERPFIERTLKQQFALALKGFKIQEAAHAATYEQAKQVSRTFGSIDAAGYLETFSGFLAQAQAEHHSCVPLLENAGEVLSANTLRIEQYTGFLTHTDFVPHNFRVLGEDIYLLDHASLRFGNKYEGWARFLNFMSLYNPELDRALVSYVQLNRAKEEVETLRLMRIFRLGEIITYYLKAASRSSGDLELLNRARIDLWSHMLEVRLEDREPDPLVLLHYKETRDRLRSEEEKRRQVGLH